jgi:hypothetical protein
VAKFYQQHIDPKTETIVVMLCSTEERRDRARKHAIRSYTFAEYVKGTEEEAVIKDTLYTGFYSSYGWSSGIGR